jgi:cytochrome b subunit of formate dehydrogenase
MSPSFVRIVRHSRLTRWAHTAVYVVVLVLLLTGWWLLSGQEGHPSPLASLTGAADPTVHTWAGWALTVVVALVVLLAARGVGRFVSDSVRFRREDARWFLRWPAALVTGRFPRHEGRFDPGQRVANLVLVALLATLIASGVGLTMVVGGPSFVVLHLIHRWATYLLTPVIIGHVIIASGLLPGYRGVARAIHIGGRVRLAVARRLWPAWAERFPRGTRPAAARSQDPDYSAESR